MSSYFKFLKSLSTDVLSPAFQDFMRSLPDCLVLGSGLFSLITQSFPIGILTLAMLEFMIIHKVLGNFIQQVGGNNLQPQSDTCTPGLPSPYQISFAGKLLSTITFPSGPIFLVSAAIAYCLLSISNFSQELEELSKKEPEWKARFPLAVTFSCLILGVYGLWRYTNSCDSALSVLGTTVIGLLVGFGIQLLHVYLFGRDSINFLGIPLLADRAALGKPLYACAKQETKVSASAKATGQ